MEGPVGSQRRALGLRVQAEGGHGERSVKEHQMLSPGTRSEGQQKPVSQHESRNHTLRNVSNSTGNVENASH